MPSRVEITNDNDKKIPILGSTVTTNASNRTNVGANVATTAPNKINTATATAVAAVTAATSTAISLNATIAGNPPKEFYNQLIRMMRNLQQVAPFCQ